MEIYFFNITSLRNKDVFYKRLREVDKERIEKIQRLKQTDDKLRSLGAGLLLNFIRKKYDINDNLKTDRFGKPYFENNKKYFNISHSGIYVLIAVSDENIGIDIQRMRMDKHRIAEKNFLPNECDYINAIDHHDTKLQRFCEIWTIKEAYLKMIGIGLRKPLNSFEIDMSGETPKILEDEKVSIVQFKIDKRYVVATCTQKSDNEFKIEEVIINIEQ